MPAIAAREREWRRAWIAPTIGRLRAHPEGAGRIGMVHHGSRGIVLCAFCATAGALTPAAAHHSRALFDTTVEVLVEGTVADVVWKNPHTYLTLEVARPDGRVVVQEVEVGPLSTLQPLGLTQQSLIRGERVTVRANPNRRGLGHIVVGLDVTKSNGEIYPLHVFGRARAAPSSPAATLSGNWVPTTESWLGMVQGARNWPLTERGRQGVADTVGQQASQSRCEAWPAPLLMGLPMMRTIDVRDDTVKLRFDWMNGERTVQMNAAGHPAGLAPSAQGHSIGRWEGATLMIDTVGFAPHREGAGFGVPSGEGKHLVERLSLNGDRSALTYEFTITDPLSLTAPVSYRAQWLHRPDLQPAGQPCDPEIATRFLRD
jgi:hypothetical protein